jgi:hypothetical protein
MFKCPEQRDPSPGFVFVIPSGFVFVIPSGFVFVIPGLTRDPLSIAGAVPRYCVR